MLVAIIVVGCSPQKRLSRLLTNHPELITKDTILVIDTIVFDRLVHDTSFLEKYLWDTIEIEKEKLKIKLWRVTDTVYVESEVDADTIYIRSTVIRDNVIEIPCEMRWYQKYWGLHYLFSFLFLLIISIFLFKWLIKKKLLL